MAAQGIALGKEMPWRSQALKGRNIGGNRHNCAHSGLPNPYLSVTQGVGLS
jgi:hypothetical protein